MKNTSTLPSQQPQTLVTTPVPTGIVAEEPNTTNRTLKLNNITGDWTTSYGTTTTIPASGAGGTWDSYTGSVANITSASGRWIGANAGNKAFSIAPVDGITEQTAEAYCKMQIIDNKAEVMGIQSTDPGFLDVTTKDYTIEFPALLTSGEAPDVALPLGTALTATVKAENTVGASVRESNTILPVLLAPAESAGPITGTTETVLTVGTNLNLNDFVAGDNLVMVDDTGAVANYTPTTTAITNVSTTPAQSSVIKSVSNVGTSSTLVVAALGNFANGDTVEASETFNATSSSVSSVTTLTDTFNISGSVLTSTQNAAGGDTSDTTGTTITNYSNSYVYCRSTNAGQSHGGTLGPGTPAGVPGDGNAMVYAGSTYWVIGVSSQTANQGGTWTSSNSGASWSYSGVSQMSSDRFLSPKMYSNRQGQVVVFYGSNSDYRYASTNYGQSFSGRYSVGVGGSGLVKGAGYIPTVSKWVVQRGSTYLQDNTTSITSSSWSATTTVTSGVAGDVVFQWNGNLVNPGTGNKGCMYAFGTGGTSISFTDDGETWYYNNISNASGEKIYGLTYVETSGQLVALLASTPTTGTKRTVSIPSTFLTDGVVDTGTTLDYQGSTMHYQPGMNNMQYNKSAGRVVFFNLKKVAGDPVYAYSTYGGAGGTQLNFSSSAGLSDFEVGMAVTSEPAGATANINVLNSSSAVVGGATGSWTGKQMKGPDKKGTGSISANPSFNGTDYTVTIGGSNGQWVANNSTKIVNLSQNDTVLTFTDNQDLAFLKSGDLLTATGVPNTGTLMADADTVNKTVNLSNTSGTWAATQTATGPEKSGVGNFVSTNGSTTITIENSNNQWIDNNNALSKDFFVKKAFTALNANDPAHVALQQAIVTAFANVKTNATPALTGDLYRLLAGETLTADEISALTDRLTAAVHAEKPFHLDGYYPLYYTAAGANAASPSSSNHTHVLGGNTYYIPDGVTIYHGTYVPTPTKAYAVSPHVSDKQTATTTTTTTTNTSSGGGGAGGGGGGGGGGY